MDHLKNKINISTITTYFILFEGLKKNLFVIIIKMQISRYQTTNTCSRKPSYHQIIGYILLLALSVVFFICIYPNLNNLQEVIVLTICLSTALFILIVSGLIASRIDPVDPVLIVFLNGDRNKLTSIYQTCLYCDTCNSYVLNTSRHCKICKRCVNKFDHHCIWINNCIGQENYKSFMVMIISAVFFLLIFIASAIVLWRQGNWNMFLPSMIICWIHFALAIPFFFLLGALTIFHFYLSYNGMTTFEFLTNKRQRQTDHQKKIFTQTMETHDKTDDHLFGHHPTKVQVQMDEVVFQNGNAIDQKTSQHVSKRDEVESGKKIDPQNQTVPVDLSNNENDIEKYYRRHKSLKFLGQSIMVGNLREGRMHKSNKYVLDDTFQNKSQENQNELPPNKDNIMKTKKVKVSQLILK